jgi:hypothetical protein
MSSTDPTTIGVHRALHEALNSAREARHRLEDGDATPDLDDLVELGRLLAALSESVMAVNSDMVARARLAQDASTWGSKSGICSPRDSDDRLPSGAQAQWGTSPLSAHAARWRKLVPFA